MAFEPTTLSLMVGAAGHSWWHYHSSIDSLAIINGPNYFGPAANIINRGDFMAHTSTAAAGGGNQIVMVASSDGISNVTLGTATPMAGEDPSAPPPPPPGEDGGEEPPAERHAAGGRRR